MNARAHAAPAETEPCTTARAIWGAAVGEPGVFIGSTLIAAVVGIAVALVVVFAGDPFPHDASAQRFAHTGTCKLWLFVLCAQTAFWAALVRPLLARARSLWDVWAGSPARILRALLPFVILVELAVVGASLGSKLQYPLPHHSRKILILSEIGCGVAFLGALCIALVNEKLERFRVNARVTAQDLEDYICLRDLLRRLVLIEAAIIGAAILSSGVLRKAIIAWHPKTHEFPSQYVLIYGACFSSSSPC